MLLSTKSLVLATATAIALTSFDLRPAAAAPLKGPATVQTNNGGDEFSSQRRRHRRGVHPAVPLAAFGMIVGTIGAIAESQRRREYYDRHYYYEGPVVYDAPVYDAPVYAQPYGHAPRYHHNPGYRPYHGYRHHVPPAPQGPMSDHPGSM